MFFHLKRLRAAFGQREMRSVTAGDFQRLIAASTADGLSPKTIRSLWSTVSQIWQAALAQQYIDAVLPKPMKERNRDDGDKVHVDPIERQRRYFESWANDQKSALVLDDSETSADWAINAEVHARLQRFIVADKEG
jgi:hypothetical protein